MPVIKSDELTDHPVRVGGDPDGDGKVMAEFRHILPCSPGNHHGDDQCWKDHGNTQWTPYHAPGNIFKQPENDVQVFHPAVAEGNGVGS